MGYTATSWSPRSLSDFILVVIYIDEITGVCCLANVFFYTGTYLVQLNNSPPSGSYTVNSHTHLPPLFTSHSYLHRRITLLQFICPGFAERKHQLQISKRKSFNWTAQQRLHLGIQREMTTKLLFVQDYSQFECLGQKGLSYLPELRCPSQFSKPWRHSKAK